MVEWEECEPPLTDTPIVIKMSNGVKIVCNTRGASIGYRIVKPVQQDKEMHTIRSWDFGTMFNSKLNGQQVAAQPVWQVYKGETIQLETTDTLKVNALRIGYKAATLDYVGK